MNLVDILAVALVVAVALAVAGWLAVRGLTQMLHAARAEVQKLTADHAPAAAAPEAAPPGLTPCSRWHAMPGQRIELADSGFYIVLDLRPNRHLYSLFTPEHERCAYGPSLQMLKGYGEQLAAERLEFSPPAPLAPIWRPAR